MSYFVFFFFSWKPIAIANLPHHVMNGNGKYGKSFMKRNHLKHSTTYKSKIEKIYRKFNNRIFFHLHERKRKRIEYEINGRKD